MEKGHWYTDKNGHHYFVEEGQSPKEGWEASKRRKMIKGGKYQVSEDGNEWKDVSRDEYDKYESDSVEFDENVDDDFGFDEEEGINYDAYYEKVASGEEYDSPEHLARDLMAREGLDKNTAMHEAREIWDDVMRNEFGIYDNEEEDPNLKKMNKESKKDYLEYDNNPDKEDKELMKQFDVISPQEVANLMGKKVKSNETIYEPQSLDNEYKAPYKYEDLEGARFYPTDSTMEGSKWVGRYRSIYDAHGLKDEDPDSWQKQRDMFKYVGKSDRGADIVQGPDGYYSGNPRINSMSFKTFEDAKNYLDRKNPEVHKYGAYYEPGSDIEKMYRDRDASGKEYDMEAPDAWKKSQSKQSDEGSNIDTSAGLLNFKDIISNRTDEFLEELNSQPGLKESIVAIIDKMRKKSK